jgi:hypothetical protein
LGSSKHRPRLFQIEFSLERQPETFLRPQCSSQAFIGIQRDIALAEHDVGDCTLAIGRWNAPGRSG